VRRVLFLAIPLAAVVAALFTTTLVPDRVGQQFERLHWNRGVVAGNDQFAASRALLGRLVADRQAQAGTGVQGRGEWIVKELPMRALAFECDAAHVELTVAHVADRNCAVGTAARSHASKPGRTADRQLARRRIAGNRNRPPPRRVVTVDRDGCRLGPYGGRLKSDRYFEGVSRPDGQRVGAYLGWKKLRRRRSDVRDRERAFSAIVENKRLVAERSDADFPEIAAIGQDDAEPRWRGEAGHRQRLRTAEIVAEHPDCGRARAQTGGFETQDHVERFTRVDDERIRSHSRRLELGR